MLVINFYKNFIKKKVKMVLILKKWEYLSNEKVFISKFHQFSLFIKAFHLVVLP